MEDIDQLIIRDLKSSTRFVVPPEITSLSNFNANILVNAILKCFRAWDKGREHLERINRTFATERTARVNQTNQIVKALKDLGYNEKLSYHNLLYPNPLDTRNILSWLLGQIPKETASDSMSLIVLKIEEELDYLSSPVCVWTPDFCNASADRNQNFHKLNPASTRTLYTPSTPLFYPGGRRMNAEQKSYFTDKLPLITGQAQKNSVALSVLEYNTKHFTEGVENEREWNTLGLASGLPNPMDYNKDKQRKILARMAEHIRATTASNKTEKNSDY
jgi:hypothetical protein